MHYLIRFTTSMFGVTGEDDDLTNPILGQSLLLWLKEKIADFIEIEAPDMEEWGCYTGIEWQGRPYLIGSSVMADEKDGYEWIFQVYKSRTFKEKLFGREKMTNKDACLLFFKAIFDAEPAFRNVEVE